MIEVNSPSEPLSVAMPSVTKSEENSQELSQLKQTSDSEPFQFLTEKPQPYKVAANDTIPSFTQDLIAAKTGGLTWSE